MEQRVRVHKVRLGGDEVRVIRPAPASARLALRDDRHWLSMYADRRGAEQLVAMWALAARSARSMIYLPIWANPVPDGVTSDGEPVSLDLVLVRHSLARIGEVAWALGDSKQPDLELLRFTTEELHAAGIDPARFGLSA